MDEQTTIVLIGQSVGAVCFWLPNLVVVAVLRGSVWATSIAVLRDRLFVVYDCIHMHV